MSELSKFINLVIEYGEKLESTINKKYRPFIRSICNLEQLAKSTDPQKIILTREIIIFKLGLEAKSTKSIELSLYYLQKFFGNKFIDLGQPNYCEEFEIDETTIRKKENVNIKGELRTEIMKLLEPLVHFKSTEINLLLLKVYEYLITEPIAPMLIELNLLTPNTEMGQKILYNYYSYRFYIYEEVYTFTEVTFYYKKKKEFRSINPLCIRNEKINAEIEQAFVNHEELLDLVHKYVGEIVVQVAQIGGKYGLCVICKEPADYYCKITKASLCGADCKKRHLELAEKQYKMYYQAVHLWQETKESFELLLESLSKKESRSLLTVFVGLIEKPHLFMLVKQEFRHLIGKYTTSIVNMVLNYKDEQCFELTYNMIGMLCRYWMVESISSIEYFFKECALKLIEDKRPSFKLLIGLFKSLAKIFEYGKTAIELYINFDCEFNRTNILERIMFELSKMCQDKFASTLMYNKHEKIAVKNGAFTLLSILCKGLNEYRILYPEPLPSIETEILELKQKKTSLEKFILKFNDHWSEGLKMLFNMNLVGLESDVEIVDILLTTKGLKKEKIEEMLLSQNGRQYINVLFDKIIHSGPFMGLVELFRLIPLKKSSLLLKHYSDYVLEKMVSARKDENNDSEEYSVTKWMSFLTSNYGLKELEKYMYMEGIKVTGTIDHVYMKCIETRGELTLGTHKTYFRHCISRSYIKIFEPQLSLLQIPILFLLETSYPHEKIFEIVGELVQICGHASWVGLCLKSVDVDGMIKAMGGGGNMGNTSSNVSSNRKYTMEDHSLIMGCLKECKIHADFIHEWHMILQFINKLYKLINLEPTKKLTIQSTTSTVILEEQVKIKEELSILQLEEYLLMIGENSVENFGNFIVGMIKIAEEELQRDNVFFLQKMFEILQHNLNKFVGRIDVVMGEFEHMLRRIVGHNLNLLEIEKEEKEEKLTKIKKSILPININQFIHINKPPTTTSYSSEILIYIADMLKQLFVKILKHLSNNSQQNKETKQLTKSQHNLEKASTTSTIINTNNNNTNKVEETFFRLFSLILECENKEANDFVMNSISMIIMVYSEFTEHTWSFIILDILKEHSKEYRQQTLTILQKLMKDKLKHCEHLEFELINLAIDLVDEKEIKLSIESIHLMKDFVELIIEQCEKVKMIEGLREGGELNVVDKENQERKETDKIEIEIKDNKEGHEDKEDKKDDQDNNKSSTKEEYQKDLTPPEEHINKSVIESSSESESEASSGSLILSTSPKKIKQYLMLIISNLIEFITYECHEGAIEILFILMKTKLPKVLLSLNESIVDNNKIDKKNDNNNYNKNMLFSSEEITTITNSIFKKLESLPTELLSRGEKIMNESLFWSVRNNNYMIVKNLEECIVNKFSRLSYTAMKCIKTFVSMTNPKKPEEWDPIEETLVNILGNTHLTDLLEKGNKEVMTVNVEELIYQNQEINPEHKTNISIVELSNKLIIQRMAVEVLPNDVKIIEQLLKIYKETLEFNDNVYLRCLLWREGLGKGNDDGLPDILSLEELISYRIISTYYWSKEYEKIADFTLNIIERYCQASKKWEQLESLSEQLEETANDESYELFVLCKDYWRKRRQPLKVIINYMLPKLPKICRDYTEKEKLLHWIIEGMKFSEESGQYVDTIRQMTMVR